MSDLFRKYITYLTRNPEGYWFKRKAFGWGWVPVRWQGWTVLAAYIVLVFFFSATLDPNSPPQEVAFLFFLPLLLLTIALIRICYMKGEKPRWQWGLPKEEDR